MSFISDLFSRLVAKIPVRGTLTTPSGDEVFPIAICNEIMGGPFIANSYDEVANFPVERLIKGCKCTINEHTDPETGETNPTTTLSLRAVPSDTIANLGHDVSDYWVLDRAVQFKETTIEYQYSDNYLNKKPPFLSAVISKEAYNAGYATNEDFDLGDTGKIIWHSEYDPILDKWVRQRTGSLGDWGIPVKIDESYEDGQYRDVQFQWRLNSLGKPARPESMVGGKSNDNPIDWTDVPDIPEGEVYETYILTYSLWTINAIKGVYGQLLSEWSDPVKVSTNPDLVRYGVSASNSDYLNPTYWRPYYSIGDKYKASRETTESEWVVELISGESGEYTDYVFKAFPNSYEPTEDDAPTSVLGYGIDNWMDGAFEPQTGYTLYVSTSRKFSDGTLSSNWTTPTRFDGKNTIRAVIVPNNSTGTIFKYTVTNGTKVVTPSQIDLHVKIFDGVVEKDDSDLVNVAWYRNGVFIPPLPLGSAPNRNPQVGGEKNAYLTLYPENINGQDEISAVVIYGAEDYKDFISLQDATDGLGYVLAMESDSGFIYKGVETKNFTAKVYENGVNVTTYATYSWLLNDSEISTIATASVTDEQVSGVTSLTLKATINGVTYERTEALTDVSDGRSYIRMYSSEDYMEASWNPDNQPSKFSTSSANAVWAIEKLEGGSWGTVYRIKGEKGVPNGAFQKQIYKARILATADPVPSKPIAVTVIGQSLLPSGWSDNPITGLVGGDELYMSKATFIKNVKNENVDEIVGNWDITGSGWSTPARVTYFPSDGVSGDNGAPGEKGWSPQLAIVTDGDRRVQKIQSWTGGQGTPPTSGLYIGSTGLVSSISSATDIRGARGATGLAGADGIFKSSDYWDGNVYTYKKGYGEGKDSQFVFHFRRSKTGVIHYIGRCYRDKSDDRWDEVTISNNLSPMSSFNLIDTYEVTVGDPLNYKVRVGLTGTYYRSGTTPSHWTGEGRAFIYSSGTTQYPSLTLRVNCIDNYVGIFHGVYMSDTILY